jgi:hypothetical protein
MPQSANFSVQNALKLTYKHPEIKKIFRFAIARHKGRERKGGIGGGRGREGLGEGREGKGRGGKVREGGREGGTDGETKGSDGGEKTLTPQVF